MSKILNQSIYPLCKRLHSYGHHHFDQPSNSMGLFMPSSAIFHGYVTLPDEQCSEKPYYSIESWLVYRDSPFLDYPFLDYLNPRTNHQPTGLASAQMVVPYHSPGQSRAAFPAPRGPTAHRSSQRCPIWSRRP